MDHIPVSGMTRLAVAARGKVLTAGAVSRYKRTRGRAMAVGAICKMRRISSTRQDILMTGGAVVTT